MKKEIEILFYYIFFFFPVSLLYIIDVLAMHYIVGFIPFVCAFLIFVIYLIKKINQQIKNVTIVSLFSLSVISVLLSSILCAVKPYRLHIENVENGIEITGYSVNWINDYKKEFIIELPSTIRNKEVISIGAYAFNSCPYFDELVIPEGVKEIKERAFADSYYCKLILPETLLEIETEAFSNAEKTIDYIILPSNLENVGELVFYYTTKNIFAPFSEAEINDKNWGYLWPWYYGEDSYFLGANGEKVMFSYNTDVYYDVKDVDIKEDHYVITYNDGTTEKKLKIKY